MKIIYFLMAILFSSTTETLSAEPTKPPTFYAYCPTAEKISSHGGVYQGKMSFAGDFINLPNQNWIVVSSSGTALNLKILRNYAVEPEVDTDSFVTGITCKYITDQKADLMLTFRATGDLRKTLKAFTVSNSRTTAFVELSYEPN